jgi:hypothetical protein
MRELLIRYLLGELDEDEFRDVQAQLKNSPELRQELAHLRECFAAHQDDDFSEDAPPRDLAARTAERVAESDDAWEVPAADQPGLHPAGDPPAGILGWSLADLTVAGGVMLAVSMLIFPALRNSRDGTRRVVCQNQQKDVYQLVALDARDHGGYFPRIGLGEPAGMFVARLIMRNYAEAEDIAKCLVCPGSKVAQEIRAGRFKFVLPGAEKLRAMSREQLIAAAALMSPCYSYRFPYVVGNDVYYIRNDFRALSPIFADTTEEDVDGSVSPNHGGEIVLVSYGDGGVRPQKGLTLPGSNEDMFHNDDGKVAVGLRPGDIVLGRSNAMPMIKFVSQK